MTVMEKRRNNLPLIIVLLVLLYLLFGCTSQRYIMDNQIQVTLIRAYKEVKTSKCTMPRNLRTWHVDLLTKKGDTISYHYFTESFAKQSWLIPGDKYTIRYMTGDSLTCDKYKLVFADLKRNN